MTPQLGKTKEAKGSLQQNGKNQFGPFGFGGAHEAAATLRKKFHQNKILSASASF